MKLFADRYKNEEDMLHMEENCKTEKGEAQLMFNISKIYKIFKKRKKRRQIIR